MFQKATTLFALGMMLTSSVPALAQHHGHHPQPQPAPRQPDRRDHRRPDVRRPDVRRPVRDNRRGQWHHGGVVQRGGRYRYVPSRPYAYRPNPYRYPRYVGRWEDWIIRDMRYGTYRDVHLIGATYLESRMPDYDVIDVNDWSNCVRMVRLRVEQAAAHIDRVVLHFVDGGSEELDVNGYYAANTGDYMWRDLYTAWGERCIDSVVVLGQSMPTTDRYGRYYPGGQARVELWGLR